MYLYVCTYACLRVCTYGIAECLYTHINAYLYTYIHICISHSVKPDSAGRVKLSYVVPVSTTH